MAGGAGSRFVEVTLEEIERLLKRGFRVLRPKEIKIKGSEIAYNLKLSEFVVIQVQTAITRGQGTTREIGTDTMKVRLMTTKGSPLLPGAVTGTKPGKAAIKRMKNWKATLQKRIEEAIELFEDKEDYWNTRAGDRDSGGANDRSKEPGVKPARQPPSDGQVKLLMGLLGTLGRDKWRTTKLPRQTKMLEMPDEAQIRSMNQKQVSWLIGQLKGWGLEPTWGRYSYDRQPVTV